MNIDYYVAERCKFQFHYGTIKSFSRALLQQRNVHFNSTMVRLKELNNLINQSQTIFQFHYGTIKRKKLIRLPVLTIWFQFHYGTIKSKLTSKRTTEAHNFNSTMVRLKAFQIVIPVVWKLFQFHYGTIKRPSGIKNSIEPYISIPLWYD